MDHKVRKEIQAEQNKVKNALSQKMNDISNQAQILNDQLLTPFAAHNINMEVFFLDVSENVKQREKEIKEKSER